MTGLPQEYRGPKPFPAVDYPYEYGVSKKLLTIDFDEVCKAIERGVDLDTPFKVDDPLMVKLSMVSTGTIIAGRNKYVFTNF